MNKCEGPSVRQLNVLKSTSPGLKNGFGIGVADWSGGTLTVHITQSITNDAKGKKQKQLTTNS